MTSYYFLQQILLNKEISLSSEFCSESREPTEMLSAVVLDRYNKGDRAGDRGRGSGGEEGDGCLKRQMVKQSDAVLGEDDSSKRMKTVKCWIIQSISLHIRFYCRSPTASTLHGSLISAVG